MITISQRDTEESNFSFKRGIYLFVKANCIILLVLLIFLSNYKSWDWDGHDYLMIFLLFPQPFIFLLGLIAAVGKPDTTKKYQFKNNKDEWIGLASATTVSLLFSLLFLGAGLAFPSTIVFLCITTNFMAAAFSVVFHPLTISLFEANVFVKCKTKKDYFYKYIAIITTGINYHTQKLLRFMPLVINKFLAVLFVILLVWQLFGVIMIFGD
ncbi:hypothetical protein [Virgibacillus halodenitrificans]|uniref:hypothetical protein n=1 Tax=Virgibacillus halodenitrificans TaxID=1482 RepID=UPI00045CD87B|nr:hypothetical protein [Virgibacillus halodenitrificans]MEC2158224.1 hypothetical protein [Virgibacillus halodenitrificans]CDQ31156.1 hypothetical protein BN993_00528 [Virgibacillus halodenitrificans]